MRTPSIFALAVALVFTLWAQSTSAQDAAEIEARSLFEAGRVAFGDGRFEEALERFERAYELSGRPTLLYNIASAHDRLGNIADAIAAYERYLAEMPEPENRSFVEARLRILGEQAARTSGDAAPDLDPDGDGSGEAEEGALATPVATPVRTSDDGPAIAAGVLLSLAGLTGGAGIGLGAYSMSLRGELEDRCVALVCAPADRGDVDTLATTALLADVMLGASLATAIGGIIALAVSMNQPEADVVVSVAASPYAVSVSATQSF